MTPVKNTDAAVRGNRDEICGFLLYSSSDRDRSLSTGESGPALESGYLVLPDNRWRSTSALPWRKGHETTNQ